MAAQQAEAQCTTGPSGTISVGPTGTYSTLTAAIAATTSGISGSVIFELQSTYTSSGETFPLTFSANTCVIATRTITVRPASGATGLSITSANGTATIDFSGAQYITIDGRPGGTGTTSQLTISNTSTSAAATTRLINDASNNTVTYCTLSGSSTTSGVVFFSTGTTTGNDNNTFSNDNIGPAGSNQPLNSVYSLGSSTAIDNSGNTITACNIFDFFNASSATNGLNLSTGNSTWTISNNRLYQTADRLYTTGNTHTGINIGSGAGYTITGNIIGFATASGTGTTNLIGNSAALSGFPGVYVVSGTANATRYIGINGAFNAGGTVSSIQSNTIGGFTLYTSSGAATANGMFCGIAITSGSVNIGTAIGNVIGSASGTGSVYAVTSTTGGIIVGIYTISSNAVAIRNNTIAALDAMGTTSSISGGINGINIAGTSSSYDVSGNTIGNATNPNLRMGNLNDASGNLSNAGTVFGIASGNGLFNGILSAQTANGTIGTVALPNIIRNASLNSSGTSASIRGITASGSPVISSNQISNLTCQTTSTGLGSTLLAGMGIFLNSISTAGAVVTKNNINGLSLTNATTNGTNITGIAIYAGASDISANRIYNISNASTSTTAATPGTASGIFLRQPAGNQNIFNNMISLGNGQANNTAFNGIWMQNSVVAYNMNCYFNSINIEGTVTSGSMPSFCFNRGSYSATTVVIPVDIRNNIFVNTRSGSSTKNYAIGNCYGATAVSTGWGTNASNYNVLNAASTTIGYWTSDVTFSGWKTASASDANSLSGVSVPFLNSATADLHVSFSTTPTQLESGGTPISGITTDYDNQTRPGPAGSTNGGGCAPDIGADEFDGVPLDLTGPTITYTALGNTSCTSTGTRVVSGVTITDCSNVNTTTGTKPRLYYRKSTDANTYAGNTSSDNGWKYVESTSSSSPFSFTIDYTKLQAALSTGDILQYFIIAQDLATTPNVGVNNATFSAAPTSVALTSSAFPVSGTINSFTIVSAGLTGTVTIGATGSYTTLTDATGLFNAINTIGLTGNVTATIIDASITESGSIALNTMANTGCVAGTYTLTIKPQAALSATLTGSNATSLIKLNGADNVTIDGSNNATTSQNLTITNTNTGTPAVIWLASTLTGDGATGNVIKNCIVTGNAITTTLGCLVSSGSVLGGVAEAANTGNTYQNNTISLAQYGIAAVGPASMETGMVVANNNVGTATGGIGFRGMFISNQNATQITGNTIQNITPISSPAAAILLAGTTDAVNITANSISNINSSAAASGTSSISAISVGAATQTNTIINGNTITGVQSSNTSGYGVRGIIILGNGTIVSNNMLSDIYNYQDASATLYATVGISVDGGVTGVKILHNSVNLYGSHPGFTTTGGVSACMYVNATATAGVDIRNNVFSNSYDNSSSTGDKAYAIYSVSGNTVYSAINNNDYYVSGSGTPVLGFLGTDLTTLAQVQSTFGGNANSYIVAPIFTSSTNLHLSNAAGANWCLNSTGATGTGITTDIDVQTRSTPPDIGADEFTPTDNSVASPNAQTSCSGTAITTIALSGVASSFSWTRDNTASVTGITASGTGNINGILTNTTSAPVTVTFTITPLNASGCAFGSNITATIIVNPTPTVAGTPASQSICTGGAITTIVNSGTVTGTVFNWARNNTGTVTGIAASGTGNISGTLTNITTLPVVVTFTVTPSYTNAGTTCAGTAASIPVTVNPVNTISLSSAAGTTAQTVCLNTPITSITYATTGATGATFSGLPAGLSGSWTANVATISGSATASGAFSYTVTLTGGCGTVTAAGSITITPNNTITLSSAAGTNSQTVCINSPATTITYATTGATGATITGLPAGMSGSWAANVVTISGTPTAAGSFNYTINLTGGCGTITAFGNMTVSPTNTIALSSVAGTASQAICINTPITNITYSTTGATGATFSGLPAGVSGIWAGNAATISGSPTALGSYSYTVTLTGGCGTITAAGTITVINANTITLSSAAGSNAQTVCINTAITNITYNTAGATGASFSGLPAGVSGIWAASVVTISGTPTASGTFNYTVTLTGGCGGTITTTGSVTVIPANTATLTSAAGTNAQTKCINNAITNITYSTAGATGATFSGLPTGINGVWASNVITISGTPSVSGTYNYTATLTGGCGSTAVNGTITVNPNNTITLTSSIGSNTPTQCINTALSNITYATTGATAATFTGLPAGITGAWAANVATISGTPTAVGTYNYTVTLTGGCGSAIATGTIIVSPNNSITLTSLPATTAQTKCVNTAITTITYATTGATGATFSGLPAGVNGVWAGNVVTISGTPVVPGTYSYTVTLTGGCATITATGSILVNSLPTVFITPATAAIICAGTGITLTGNGAVSYAWSPGIGLSATTGTSVTANPGFSLTYTVTGTDANGCVNTATKAVTVNGLPNITITPAGPISFCQGLSTTLTAFGASTYSWSPAAGLSSTIGNPVIASPATTTTYTVTGTAANGCVNTATKTVTIIPAPDPTITPAGYINICQDDTVHFSAKPGYASYEWRLYGVNVKTGTDQFATFTGGFYTLKVTDASGCTATTPTPSVITVTQHPFPIITRLGAALDAGAGYSSYQWYLGGSALPGANGQLYTPLKGGSYTVAVTDTSALHCPGQSEASIYTGLGIGANSLADAIRLYPNPANNLLHIDAPVTVNVTISSMDGKQVYTGAAIREVNISAFADGVYRVLITDRNGNYLKTEKITKLSR